MKDYICSECGDHCNGHIVDFGIGGWEMGDQHGFQSRKQFVSECCDAQMMERSGDMVPLTEEN